MKHKAYIFDFDGTLVHSNLIKRDAFYKLTPEILLHPEAVTEVLSKIPERSRFEIIAEIYKIINSKENESYAPDRIALAILNYSTAVRDGVLNCPELIGATPLLKALKKADCIVYISSNTPEESLGELIEGRQWSELINGFFGFPKLKNVTVKNILLTHALNANDVIIIGDGDSDEMSAGENGCDFYRINHELSLKEFYESLITSTHHV
ncbi:MAG: HAD hydrolase-like protein [Chryseolinea sp.]